MNNISEKDIINSVDKINKLYDNLSYLDTYGTSVLLFIIITIFVFLIQSYCIVMRNAADIKSDWVNQRCNPKVIPFAGFINKPDNKSIVDYTGENFSYCVQDILTNITGFAVQPFNYLISALTSVFNEIQQAINTIREFLTQLRTNVQNIAQDILSRILNVLIPIQQIFIILKDSLSKVQGILTAGLYTSLGTYYTLQALMGAILELIIKVLITLAIIIVGLWILPFTWPAAASMTAVFIAISIPMTIIVLFMTEVLHIQTSGVPKIPHCFDKNTLIKMNDGTFKRIIEIKVGDLLQNNNRVTSKIKVTSQGTVMYKLNNIIVSDSHIVKYNNKWIPVSLYPDKTIAEGYQEPYLYCLNTVSKEIIINNIVFTDWDEIYDKKLETIIRVSPGKEYIHELYSGFLSNTKVFVNKKFTTIDKVNVGDQINEDIIYGIVELEYSNKILNIMLDENDVLEQNTDKLYHLLTYSNKFTIGSKVFDDYNSFIDFYFQE
jgi:hypothetical protein